MRYILCLTIVLSYSVAFAHPVAFKNSTAVMTWNQSFMTDNWISYSFQSNMALTAQITCRGFINNVDGSKTPGWSTRYS
ncbi:hypothetical protein K2X05_12140 [bacterium]|nr:hypothetical protein [bacterium]